MASRKTEYVIKKVYKMTIKTDITICINIVNTHEAEVRAKSKTKTLIG